MARGIGDRFAISKTIFPAVPGCTKLLLRCVKRPMRANLERPSTLADIPIGRVIFSSVMPCASSPLLSPNLYWVLCSARLEGSLTALRPRISQTSSLSLLRRSVRTQGLRGKCRHGHRHACDNEDCMRTHFEICI